MLQQKLSTFYSLCIEPNDNKLRLIVLKNDEEFVCRKENLKKLNAFLSTENDQIFKGRLQLKKIKDVISVEIKGEVIGAIKAADFKKLLAAVN